MLQEFLNHNFIQITEDDNLNKLKKACDEVTKKIGKDKPKIITYTLTALDPEVKAQDPALTEVQEIIIKHWNTFLANTKDTPVTFIRAVMLEALEAVSKDLNSACLIWHTGRNIVKHYKLGREEELITSFLLQIGNRIEEEAQTNWALPSQVKIEKLSIEIKELTGATIDKTELENQFKAGFIHSGWGNSGENPHHHGTHNASWPLFASQRTAQGISEIINKALKKQAKDISANQSQIQEAANKLLSETHKEILQKNILLQMRTELLWWKESAYSPSMKKSYRELKNSSLQPIIACDYASFVPSVYPASADHFLKETHRYLFTEAEKPIKIADIITDVQKEANTLRSVFSEPTIEGGRISLLNFLIGLVWNKYTIQQLQESVGISVSKEISLTDFTLWLFHDLQSVKIATTK